MRNKALQHLHQECKRKEVVSAVSDKYGNRCANCGATENIQYHHIVPLHMGGTNNPSNIIPLCTICHKKVHGASAERKYKAAQNGGRPRMPITDEMREAIALYVDGRIDPSELKKSIGVTHIDWSDRRLRLLLDEMGIEKIRNLILIKIANGWIVEPGDCVGWVKWKDGKQTDITAKRTYSRQNCDVRVKVGL